MSRFWSREAFAAKISRCSWTSRVFRRRTQRSLALDSTEDSFAFFNEGRARLSVRTRLLAGEILFKTGSGENYRSRFKRNMRKKSRDCATLCAVPLVRPLHRRFCTVGSAESEPWSSVRLQIVEIKFRNRSEICDFVRTKRETVAEILRRSADYAELERSHYQVCDT